MTFKNVGDWHSSCSSVCCLTKGALTEKQGRTKHTVSSEMWGFVCLLGWLDLSWIRAKFNLFVTLC